MSDGYWDAEYDAAYFIVNEAEEILKSKNLTFEDIMTPGEIDDFNKSPRIKDAEVILNRAKVEGNMVKELKLPYKLNERWIHKYEFDKTGYCIGHSEDEVFIDEEECEFEDITENSWQEKLKEFGAITYDHVFEYSDGYKRTVHDTYFERLEDCIKCVESLESIKGTCNEK